MDLLNELLTLSNSEQKLGIVKKIRNGVIGNRKQKKLFINNGILARIVDVWIEGEGDADLLCELATVIGSLVQGVPEAVDQLIQCGGLILLLKGLCHSQLDVVSACLKGLGHIYSTGLAPGDVIFQDTNNVRQIVGLLNQPSPNNEYAAVILASSCQCPDHQHFLLANGITLALYPLLVSTSHKVVCAGLRCLSSVITGNEFAASASINVPGHESILSLLANLQSYSPSIYVKLEAAICLTKMYQANAISSTDPIISLKLIPGLVFLCKSDIEDNSVRAIAATTLGELVSEDFELQEIAATTDGLLPSLTSFFLNKPNEDDEFIDERDIVLYNNLCKSVLNLLAKLSSSVEDVRFKVVSQTKMIYHLTQSLQSDVPDIKMSATKCLLSLSRSTKLLRTYLSDAEIHVSKPILEMLSSDDEEYVLHSTSLVCNLLLSFCPCREVLIKEGIIETLCSLSTHSNSVIQLNAIWALMNCAREAGQNILEQIRQGLPIEQILSLIQQQQDKEQLIMKCLGLLVNLTQTGEEANIVMEDQGVFLTQTLGTLLALGSSNDICEQALCVLVNVSNGNSRNRDRIAENVLLLECLAQLLRTNTNTAVLMAGCTLVQHLADSAYTGHIHRQNCLDEVGIQLALQKLELTENSLLQDLTREVLELFQTASL